MEMRQNCARSKKKLSRIILPDDSSEEENTVNDNRESSIVFNPSTVNKSNQQDHCLNIVCFGSSLQSKDRCAPVVNQSPQQRQQTPLHLKDEVSDFKPQSCNKIEPTSPSFSSVDSQKDCRKFPIHLKVWIKLEKKTFICLPKEIFCCFPLSILFFFFEVIFISNVGLEFTNPTSRVPCSSNCASQFPLLFCFFVCFVLSKSKLASGEFFFFFFF